MSHYLVPSKLKIRKKKKRNRKIQVKIGKSLNKKLELEKNKSTVFDSDTLSDASDLNFGKIGNLHVFTLSSRLL